MTILWGCEQRCARKRVFSLSESKEWRKNAFFKTKKKSFIPPKDPNLKNLELSIIEKVGLNISIKNKKNNTGSLVVEYKDLDQLNKIIEIIKSNY